MWDSGVCTYSERNEVSHVCTVTGLSTKAEVFEVACVTGWPLSIRIASVMPLPLTQAIHKRDLDSIRTLLHEGVDVNLAEDGKCYQLAFLKELRRWTDFFACSLWLGFR